MTILSLIMIGMGFLFLYIAIRRYQERKRHSYAYLPIARATVLKTVDFGGDRWLVRFTTRYGREVLGMDDKRCVNVFHPEKHSLPKRDTLERVYYWKYTGKSKYRLNGKKVNYYIHFCNESFYEIRNRRENALIWVLGVLGVILLVFGYIILLYMNV